MPNIDGNDINKLGGVDTSLFLVTPQYNDIFPSNGWEVASGGAVPDVKSHTVAGLAVNFRCFNGVNTEERMAASFEITHEVDTVTLNLDVIKAEVHAHIMATTTAAGVVKCFYDMTMIRLPHKCHSSLILSFC